MLILGFLESALLLLNPHYTHYASKTRRQAAGVQFGNSMVMLFKLVCWVVLLACYRVVVRTYSVLRIPMPMDSFFRPHNLRKFRPC
jgi:hypothetical protein